MATQIVTASPSVNESVAGAFRRVFEYHPDSNITPYVDGRDMAGLLLDNGLGSTASVVVGSITGAAGSDSDGIDVLLPFSPKAVLLFNQTDSLVYLRIKGLPTTLKLTTGPAISFSATGVLFNNLAATNNLAFHIQAAEIATAGKVFHYLALA